MVRSFRIVGYALLLAGIVLCLSPYFSFLHTNIPQYLLPHLALIVCFFALAWSGLFWFANQKSKRFCGSCGSAFRQEPRCTNTDCRAKLVAGQDHCLECGTKVILHRPQGNSSGPITEGELLAMRHPTQPFGKNASPQHHK